MFIRIRLSPGVVRRRDISSTQEVCMCVRVHATKVSRSRVSLTHFESKSFSCGLISVSPSA
jgi:hypothetical protein